MKLPYSKNKEHNFKSSKLADGEIVCYCERRRIVYVGLISYAVYRILTVTIGFLGSVFASFMGVPSGAILGIAVLLLIFLAIEISNYKPYKKKMLADSHSEECSQRIALIGVLRSGMYHPFRITEKESHEISTIEKSRTRK